VSLKIVLADDSLTAQNMGKKILADAGYEVIAVSNGAQAMKKIVSDQPDLVVLDVYMPGYSGLELCERLRNSRETARTPVVLTVGKMEAFKPEEANRVGADGLIVKPFEATELVAVVKKLVENLAPAPRSKRQPTESAPPRIAEPMPAPVEPELEVQHHTVEVPEEIASEPVSGMYLLSNEEQEPVTLSAPAAAQPAGPPIEFEVERETAPVEIDPGARLASANGLSGVFEMEPSAAPAVELPAAAAPAEEFERFTAAVPAEPEPAHQAAAEPGTTIAHDFQIEEPLELVDELEADHSAGPAVETRSAAPDAAGLASFTVERLDQAQPETEFESVGAQPADALPELASWDEPLPASVSQSSWETQKPAPELAVAEPSAAEFASPGPVWVAEEMEIEPTESAISLHQQMQEGGMIDELLAPEPPASPAVSAEAPFQGWEVAEPLASDAHPGSGNSGPNGAEILPEFEPNPYAAPAEVAELGNPGPYGRADVPAQGMTATEAQPAAEPAPKPDLEPYAAAASEFVPQITVPAVNEVAADPLRIARIVEEALERLKPELIAAVARELENKNQ